MHIQRNGLFYLGVVQRETMPMAVRGGGDGRGRSPAHRLLCARQVIDFLERVHSVFFDYFGHSPVTVSTLKAQFAIVYQLLDEMADYGVPFTTEVNMLRDIVAAPSLMAGIQSSMLGHSAVSGSLPASSGMDVDWRRRDVKYRTNEMFVDLVESIHWYAICGSAVRFWQRVSTRRP